MKRSIDKAHNDGSQLETPAASSPSEGSGSGSEQTQIVEGIGSNQKLTKTDVLLYIDAVKYKFREEKEKYDEFIQAMMAFKAQRIDAAGLVARVKEILKEHPDLVLGFNMFLPKGFQAPIAPVEKELFEKTLPFLTKVKKTFQCEDNVYESFLDIISRKGNNSMSIKEEVAALFKHHPDLYSEFTQFLPGTLAPASNHHAYSGRSRIYIPRNRTSAIPAMLTAPADKSGRSHRTKTLHAGRGLSMERPEEEKVKREDIIYRRDGEEDGGDSVISELLENAGQLPRLVNMEDRDRNQVLEIDEYDPSKYEQCTPSYRFLPEDYPKCIPSQRTEIESTFLNDDLVSVPSGGKAYSFKHPSKNQHEEMLFECEDDRAGVDVLIETAKAATEQVEELLAKMNDTTNEMKRPIPIKEHLTAQSLRCIENIYGEHGLDMIELLTNNLQLALPVISTRLKLKQEEWDRSRSGFIKVWAQVYADNHHKSLDHRSLLKQQDSDT